MRQLGSEERPPYLVERIELEEGDWTGQCLECSAIVVLGAATQTPNFAWRTGCHDEKVIFVVADPGAIVELMSISNASMN